MAAFEYDDPIRVEVGDDFVALAKSRGLGGPEMPRVFEAYIRRGVKPATLAIITNPDASPEAVGCAVRYAWFRHPCQCGGGHDFGNSYWTDVVEKLTAVHVDLDDFWARVRPEDITTSTRAEG
ncbi:hypothetical protein SAMN05660199_01166 [Klenkia soli]|uniref:Uncharacterized protein n=1 Tax=Klenkia soli TaxID=1052260 RepID=A0A1H0G806_9ACTN|nr:hypothetical protein [Klenkia soli]SDO03012.1 hypothetical protein SAMN05660199_01166 [Klenkia soli]